jgi:hypothetical protein
VVCSQTTPAGVKGAGVCDNEENLMRLYTSYHSFLLELSVHVAAPMFDHPCERHNGSSLHGLLLRQCLTNLGMAPLSGFSRCALRASLLPGGSSSSGFSRCALRVSLLPGGSSSSSSSGFSRRTLRASTTSVADST